MFNRDMNFPKAVTSRDDHGIKVGIAWCRQLMKAGDKLHVWTHLKSNLGDHGLLTEYVNRHRDVIVLTGRGGGNHAIDPGPVLMCWADLDDIGELSFHSDRLRGLAVVSHNVTQIQHWVDAVKPDLLGDTSMWEDRQLDVHPVVAQELESLTLQINHSNSISGGYERDDVLCRLTALRSVGAPMDPLAMEAWALAHGWDGSDPATLAKYVRELNQGKQFRFKERITTEYRAELARRMRESRS